MKASKYNYIIERTEIAYWYNGIEHKYFSLPIGLSRKIETMINIPDKIAFLPDILVDKLTSGGFIIPDETDELDVIKTRNEERINRKDYMLTILPTLNCNYKCWYCIQDHIPSRMSAETIESVKTHIDYMVNVEQITSFQLLCTSIKLLNLYANMPNIFVPRMISHIQQVQQLMDISFFQKRLMTL